MARVPGAQGIGRLWLNLSLTAKGGAVVAIPVICTISMLALLADLQRRFETAMRAVVHTEQVLSQSRDILAAALNAEATARGYLLTHDDAFLDLHRMTRRQLSNGFSQILVLTDDSPDQQGRIRDAMRLMHDELDELDAQLRMTGPELNAAVSASRRRVTSFRAGIADFESRERRLLADRERASVQHRDSLRRGLWGFCVVGALSSVLGSFLFTTSVKRRLICIAENAARYARRESDRPVDGGRDTIGRLEETLVATTRTLLDREQRLSANAAELERAKLAAEAAVKAKTEFCATVSHEIRSPINAMLRASELLAATSLSAKQAEHIRLLERAGNNVLAVINDVLDQAKIESGRLELEHIRFDLAGLLEGVVDLMSRGASEKGIDLLSKRLPEAPRHVMGDPSRLQRVLVNLVSNAVKFTDAGFVAIKVEAGDAPDLLHFTVADTGVGIPRDRQEVIFEKSAQTEASITRTHGGSGSGLAMSRHVVELMGGRIWVESDEGAGATFHFTAMLPASPACGPEPRVEPAVAAPHRPAPSHVRQIGARILLADDSADGVSLIQSYLAESGCALEVAGDGEAALARLTESRYNLVLMDVETPKLDGHEVIRRFREWERAESRPRTPVVAVAAHASQDDIDKAIKAGADAQLARPFRREVLLAAIELCQRPESMPDVRVAVPDFIRELAPEFLRRQRHGLLTVSAAWESGDFDAVRSFAHNMKGCGKSFGFPRLTEMGREMERAAKDCDADLLGRQIAELREYLTEVDVA